VRREWVTESTNLAGVVGQGVGTNAYGVYGNATGSGGTGVAGFGGTQEYEKVFPEWVGTNPDGFKTIDTTGRVVLLFRDGCQSADGAVL
jgi:hypothetical protein